MGRVDPPKHIHDARAFELQFGEFRHLAAALDLEYHSYVLADSHFESRVWIDVNDLTNAIKAVLQNGDTTRSLGQ